MTISQLTASLLIHSSHGYGSAFSGGVDVSWDDYYDLRAELQKITNKILPNAFSIAGVLVYRSKTVTNGAVWPHN